MNYLVTGGAGYIGSHMVKKLLERGETVIVLDNLSTGHADAVPSGARFFNCDLRNLLALNAVFESIPHIDAVFHFAGLSIVSQSVQYPELYYDNNVCGTLYLLDTMVRFNVKFIVFSSSAAAYDELSPYGTTKAVIEKMIQYFGTAHRIRSAALRYFNAAGAAPDGTLGERHTPETHLIPNAINAALHGTQLTIYGDGTQVRDYIHVDDLCRAHLLALWRLLRMDRNNSTVFSSVHPLGSGRGTTVNGVIHTVEYLFGCTIRREHVAERKGDPARLVADIAETKNLLNWRPQYTMEDIVTHAFMWHSKQ